MRFPFRKYLLALLLLAAVLALAATVLAQAGGGYDLGWHTIDGGGGASSGGGYSLGGASGQPDAGGHGGGSYTLNGGFWDGAGGEPVYPLYLPVILAGQ
ncbi:MAG: hypothetical protein L0332_22975 [Chloroflexi bacterium]|nr:hypothetical protein [Chloroflexota bacterium]MCI0578216.1 hypothetical protein [Chloroflexota bacterium]MCI0645291.1 hypothetical protein [Chloroflexota bacterium]MCI0729555.1 hypothetical protein [Chloroflexota bacterium]